MLERLTVGATLYHKYLSNVIIVEVCEDRIKADTGSRGVLEFIFNDFGKVLFFEKTHVNKSFDLWEEYIDYCNEANRLKVAEAEKAEQERETKRLLQIRELEKKKQLEIEQLNIINEEKKKKAQINNYSIHNNVSKYDAFNLRSLMEEPFPNRETISRIKRDQEDKIREIIDRRKIQHLVHYTRTDNLHSILQNGLIPVSMQQQKKILSVHNDDQRVDSKLDCTSCSITFPNYKLFFSFREHRFPGTRWAIIVVNRAVLFSPSNIAYFCHTNAAGVLPRIASTKDLCTAKALENMFCDSLITKENNLVQRTSLQISDCLTTDPQAEILISNVIDRKYIDRVCFQNQRDIDEYLEKNGPDLLRQYDIKIAPELFAPRNDYMFWKKEC